MPFCTLTREQIKHAAGTEDVSRFTGMETVTWAFMPPETATQTVFDTLKPLFPQTDKSRVADMLRGAPIPKNRNKR